MRKQFPQIGDVVRCDVLPGDIVPPDSPYGGYPGYTLVGIGLVPMRDVYDPEDLTDLCRPTDKCWAAKVIAVPPMDGGHEPGAYAEEVRELYPQEGTETESEMGPGR